jgi:hypothetical protein
MPDKPAGPGRRGILQSLATASLAVVGLSVLEP